MTNSARTIRGMRFDSDSPVVVSLRTVLPVASTYSVTMVRSLLVRRIRSSEPPRRSDWATWATALRPSDQSFFATSSLS
jgi:hypothetical protein